MIATRIVMAIPAIVRITLDLQVTKHQPSVGLCANFSVLFGNCLAELAYWSLLPVCLEFKVQLSCVKSCAKISLTHSCCQFPGLMHPLIFMCHQWCEVSIVQRWKPVDLRMPKSSLGAVLDWSAPSQWLKLRGVGWAPTVFWQVLRTTCYWGIPMENMEQIVRYQIWWL